MTSQRDLRRALLGEKLTAVNLPANPAATAEKISPSAPPAPHHERMERVMSGAVGAVSRSLDQMQQSLRSAQALAASGEHILELDPALIDHSIMRDRLAVDDGAQAELVEAIRSSGQQVPILVRPRPGSDGRYQVAYGHRRLAAARQLGRKVLAIVRTLSDRDLLIAQGQENSARRDLSFIERATFALRLEMAGIEREAIMAALGVDKTELSRLISVASALPMGVIEAIGPAPKTGRPRWLELAEKIRLKGAEERAGQIIGEAGFAALDSDARFLRVLESLARKKAAPAKAKKIWVEMEGRKFVHINRSKSSFTLEIDTRTAPNFGEFVTEKLPDLYAEFRARQK